MNKCSLLVLDDERLAREFVVNLLDWDRLGVGELYEADNCRTALEIMEEHQIDIVFLDIKMPEMSGTDLLFVLQQKNIDVEVIVLSGYSDFESARKMLKTGKVVEYLLKPVSEDLAAEAVAKAIANIEKKQHLVNMQGMLNKVAENERKRMFQAYIFNYVYEPDAGNEATCVPGFAAMQVAAAYCPDAKAIKGICNELITYKISHLQNLFACEQPGYYALLFASDKPGIDTATHNICGYISEKTGSFCGIGPETASIFDLNTSYRQAFFACESRLFIKKNVVDAEDINKQLKTLIDRDDLVNKMTYYVRANDTKKINELLKLIIQSFFVEVSKDASSKLYDLGIAKAYFLNLMESVAPEQKRNLSSLFSANSMSELYHIIQSTLIQCAQYYTQDKTVHKKKLISEVKKFVSENYSKPITLNQAADVVFINPSYLSRLFPEVEGCVFTDYIARVRVEEAKKLLSQRKYKVYEVADLVGYKSFKYFLKVFKEKEGITPAQYREKNIFI